MLIGVFNNENLEGENKMVDELKKEMEHLKYLIKELSSEYETSSAKSSNGDYDKTLNKFSNLYADINNQIAKLNGMSRSNANNNGAFISHSNELSDMLENRRTEFESRIKLIYKGMALANKLCTYDNSTLYILMYRQAGDIMNLLVKIPSIKKYYGAEASRYHFDGGSTQNVNKAFAKKKLISKICIITKVDTVGVVRLFSDYIDEIISLKYDEIKALACYALSPASLHQNIFCEADGMRIMGNRNETDETQWCRIKMFGGVTDLERELCVPHDVFKSCCQPQISDLTKQLTDDLLKKEKIESKNTVILCPYAKYNSVLEISFWEKFAEKQKEIGKKVYTYFGWGESVVNGTAPLNIDIDILACLSKLGCKIIAVHGGTSDVLNKVAPENLICLSVIKNDKDKEYAKARNVVKEVNYMPNGSVYLKLEHFEDDYVGALLQNI